MHGKLKENIMNAQRKVKQLGLADAWRISNCTILYLIYLWFMHMQLKLQWLSL